MATETSQSLDHGRSGDARPTDLLIVGTLGGGGIHHYVDELSSRLPDSLSVSVYDMETPSPASGLFSLLRRVQLVVHVNAQRAART